MNSGSSTRLIYDGCEYTKKIQEATSPLNYYMYSGKFENENKCIQDRYWRPFELVDFESELLNLYRTSSRCVNEKFHPECKMDGKCIRTNDERNPVVLAPEVCPILQNNIPKFYEQPLLNIISRDQIRQFQN
jgi:hypothetical protein